MDFVRYEFEQEKLCSNSRKAGSEVPGRMGKRLIRNITEAQPFFATHGKNLPVLDIGCGDGWGLECWKKFGFSDLYGIELVQSRVDTARKYGLNVFKGVAENVLEILKNNALEGKQFNIFASHVLEHCFDQKKAIQDLQSIANIFWIIVPVEETGRPTRAHRSFIRNLEQLSKYFSSKVWTLLKTDLRHNCESEGLLGFVKK